VSGGTPTFWAAPDLAKLGYPVFPVGRNKQPSVNGGFYAATTDLSQLAEWIEEGRGDHAVAFATGLPSGVVVPDADTPETYEWMRKRYGEPHVKTERGGHWYFRHPQDGKVLSRALKPGLDCKGDGGYVLAPPGRGRTWTNGIPDRTALPKLPDELRPRTVPPGEANGSADYAGQAIPSGARNKTLASDAGSMRRRGMSEAEILAALTVANEQRCRPPLEVAEIRKIAASVARYEPAPEATARPGANGSNHAPPPREGKAQPPTHDELRDRWIANHPHRAHGLGEWRRYEHGIWPTVSETSVKAEIAGEIEAAKAEGIKPTASILNSTAELARVKVYVPDEWWDADPNTLVCANGALNLATRELLPHAKEHYATAGVPYEYAEGARAEVWEQRVMGELVGEHLGIEAVGFLQEYAGYCLTTSTEHEIALWFTGKHGGGRSTILAGLEAMLGPRVGVLSLSDIERSSFALTNLPGKTLVTATEQPMVYLRGGGTLNAIISGEPMQVDRKYRDPITVVPRCKIAWAMNDLPRVGNLDDGIFRRVKIVELPEIAPEKRDPRVKEQVRSSGAGILCWALDGLDRLRARGRFEVPKSIRTATEGFKEHNDVPALFIEEACERAEDTSEAGATLYEVYRLWCLKNGHKPLANNNAAREWRRLGFESKRTPKGIRWQGVRVTEEAYQPYGKDLA